MMLKLENPTILFGQIMNTSARMSKMNCLGADISFINSFFVWHMGRLYLVNILVGIVESFKMKTGFKQHG